MQQKIIVTALPNGFSTRPGSTSRRISAAISLQVTGTPAGTKLSGVADMLHWAELISKANFMVMQNNTEMEAKVVSAKIDTQLWKNLFAPTVNVNAFQQEDLSKMPILSYPVKHIISYVESVIEKTGKQFADKMPDGNYFTDDKNFTGISMYQVGDFTPGNRREKPSLAGLVNPNNTGLDRIKPVLEKNKFIPFSPTPAAYMDFAQLRNFHGLHSNKEPRYKKPDQPNFEFHEILSVLASYPQLLRRLGLVIDLEVTPKNVRGASPATPVRIGADDTIRVIPTGIPFTTSTSIICPPTAFTKTDKGFYAAPLPGSTISKGHLKLNSEAFTVFQFDTDGAALKLVQQMDSLQLKKAKHIYHAQMGYVQAAAAIPFFNNEAPRKEGLPAQRSTGIGIAKNGMAETLNAKFVRMNKLGTDITSPGVDVPAGVSSPNANYVLAKEPLYADDINLGYRMDVQDTEKPGTWYSLHFRNNKYQYVPVGQNPVTINDMEADEGFIQVSAVESDDPSNKTLKVGEAFARWQGWSLSVPRPGLALNEPMLGNDQVANSQAAEDGKYKKPGNVDFTLQVTPDIKPGTLPMLRFGKKYAIKIRTVDLAGNSVPYNSNPENDVEAVVNNILYKRYEPVGSPFLVMGNDVKDGESSEQVVIRTLAGATSAESPAVRFVKPPRCTVDMAEQHKMFDKAFGELNSSIADDIYKKIIAKDPFFDVAKTTSKLEVFKGSTMEVEYLADPMAAGVSFFISENDPNPKVANPDIFAKRVSFYFNNEVTDANSNGEAELTLDTWLKPLTFKIRLEEANIPSINWLSAERTLVVKLQKGFMIKMNYACFWRPKDLLKNSAILPIVDNSGLTSPLGVKIAHGQHWMFSPWREITFVHAVQQPVDNPAILKMVPARNYFDTTSGLATQLKVHGPSTDKLEIEALWDEYEDDVTKPAMEIIPTMSKVFHFTTLYPLFDYVFGNVDPNMKNNPFGPIQHQFGDTKHRIVKYKAIASTRYREYFSGLIKSKGDAFVITKESNTVSINVPSSARPLAPQVEYVIPNFEWSRETVGNKTTTGRGSGLRIYLKRPWYSSGQDEKLAVVLFPRPGIPDDMMNLFSHWGTDPTKFSARLPESGGGIQPNLFIAPDAKQANLSMVEQNQYPASIAAYAVKYDKERQLYYADIMINFGFAYTPFVRLALARYQADSLKINQTDCCLSPVVQVDYVQIPSPRATSLEYKNGSKTNIIVAVSGSVPNYGGDYNNRIDIFIDPITVPVQDDAYMTVFEPGKEVHIDSETYYIGSGPINNFTFYHAKEFKLPPEWAGKPYRIRIMEYEMIAADPLRKVNDMPVIPTMASTPLRSRLVFTDVYEVNV